MQNRFEDVYVQGTGFTPLAFAPCVAFGIENELESFREFGGLTFKSPPVLFDSQRVVLIQA